MTEAESDLEKDDIHMFFGLSYANFLVLHRSLLQSMPRAWQVGFVVMLKELEDAFAHLDQPAGFHVHAVDFHGKYARDQIPHYSRGRTYIEPRSKKGAHT